MNEVEEAKHIEQDMERLLMVTGYDRDKLVDRSCGSENFHRRHLFAALLHRMGYSHGQIGRVLHRNHSTVTRMLGLRYHSPRDIERVWEAFIKGVPVHQEEERYIDCVTAYIGCSLSELRSTNRRRELSDKRCLFALLMQRKGYSLYRIGKLINRNYSTVSALLGKKHLVENELNRTIKVLTSLAGW